MSVHVFGMIGDAPVMEVEIGSEAGARAKILTWGAVLRDLVVPTPTAACNGSRSGSTRSRIMSSIHRASAPCPDASPTGSPMGDSPSTASRYQLDRKPGEKHTLHGGPKGFGKRIWKLGEQRRQRSVELALESADGEGGFPAR